MSATYEDGLAVARQVAEERDRRFEQLKASEAEADRLRRALRELHAAGRALVPHMGYISAGPSIRWDDAMGAAADALHWQRPLEED